MITGPEEIKLGYLLDPCFQLVNTAGKPLTNGYLEVYYHGTRNKYYCASDFNGTLHPFRIPLDSLGSNIVLADPDYSYDIYVYNSFGSLVMSRYNVSPGEGSGSGSSTEEREAENWSSDPQGGASTEVSKNTPVDLTLPSSSSTPEFVDHISSTAIYLKEGLYIVDAAVSFRQDEEDLENLIRDIKIETGLTGWDSMATSQRNWSGPEATDNDRHFVNLQFIYHVGEDEIQPLYFNLRSPVDLDSAKIDKLNIVKLTAGGGGYKYAAGYGIDITGQVISTSGMMPESSAARFVDIDDYHSDVSAIYDAIDEVSGAIPSLDGYATEEWVENYTSAFITSADVQEIFEAVYGSTTFAEVSQALTDGKTVFCKYDNRHGKVYKGYLASSGYGSYIFSCESEFTVYDFTLNAGDQWSITSRSIVDPSSVVSSADLAQVSGAIEQDISDVTSAITEALSDKMDKSSSADFYPRYDNPEGYLTSIPSEYVTESEMSGYVHDYTSAFITSADVPEGIVYHDQHLLGNGTSADPLRLDSPILFSANDGDYASFGPHGFATNNSGNDTHVYINSDGLTFENGDHTETIDASDIARWNSTQPGVEYSAGQYISIQDHVITASGLQPAGNYLTPSDLNGYATEQYVNEHTSAFITSADLPDVSDMATKTWVGQQGYLTSIPSEYVTETELASELSGKADASAIPDVSHFVTQEDIDRSVSGKMDSSEASAFYPMSTNPSGYLTSSDLNGYATETYVQNYTSAFITSADIPPQIEYSAGDNIDITDHVVSVTDTSLLLAGENVSITPSGDNYVISAQVPETSGYVTEQEMNDAIQSATSAFITSADIPDLPDDLVTSGELATVSGEIVNQIPSLQGYATEQYVTDHTSAFLTSADLPDLSDYATEQYVQDYTYGFVDSTYVSEYVASQVSGKQDELTFGYDSSDKINAINGSAIAGGGGGGGHEYSGANGVYVDNVNEVIGLDTSASNAIETVIENSGAWGGAGLPISAGPGIKVALENNTLMISKEEPTILFSGDLTASSSAQLTESWKNFEEIRCYGYSGPGGAMFGCGRTSDLLSAYVDGVWCPDIGLSTVASWGHRSNFSINANLPLVFSADSAVTSLNGRLLGYWNDQWQLSTNEQRCHCTLILGIDRKSN